MRSRESIRDEVSQVVASSLGISAERAQEPGFALSSARAFSSFALLELVLRLEEAFQIEIPDRDLDLERFASVGTISAYVRERLEGLKD